MNFFDIRTQLPGIIHLFHLKTTMPLFVAFLFAIVTRIRLKNVPHSQTYSSFCGSTPTRYNTVSMR